MKNVFKIYCDGEYYTIRYFDEKSCINTHGVNTGYIYPDIESAYVVKNILLCLYELNRNSICFVNLDCEVSLKASNIILFEVKSV